MKRSMADAALVALQSEAGGKRRAGAERGSVVVAGAAGSKDGQMVRARTSDLEAPIMHLTGHQSEVFCLKFAPQGNLLASAGFDKLIHIWNVYGNCANLHRLKGHKSAVLELHWSTEGERLYSASADKTVAVWDTETWARLRKIPASDEIVNTCCPTRRGAELVVSGGDDCFARLWDLRAPKKAAQVYESNYPILAAAMSDTADQVYTSDVAGEIQVWESRKEALIYDLLGHRERVTGLRLSPDGSFLLSNGADGALRCWDVRPFVSAKEGGEEQRCVKVFSGHRHGADHNLLRCAWHPRGSRVTAGSSDAPPHVYVWDTASRKVEYQLPGHRAAVNEVDFHPSGDIIGSCSSDKTIYLGELAA